MALVFLAMKIKRHTTYVSQKCCEEDHVDLLSIGEGKRHCSYQIF